MKQGFHWSKQRQQSQQFLSPSLFLSIYPHGQRLLELAINFNHHLEFRTILQRAHTCFRQYLNSIIGSINYQSKTPPAFMVLNPDGINGRKGRAKERKKKQPQLKH